MDEVTHTLAEPFLAYQVELPRLVSGRSIVAASVALGARRVNTWSPEEEDLLAGTLALPPGAIEALRHHILRGHDPLGDAYLALETVETRRSRGATYTPPPIVEAMIEWAAANCSPSTVVEPGAGSGRFLLAAGRALPGASLIAVETNPLASITCRANLAASGFAGSARVLRGDFTQCLLPPHTGPTLFIGNPPYVRHHSLSLEQKQWFAATAAQLGLPVSRLAGLHVYFFLATALLAQPGDFGIFVTSAEWLDVNYGALVRALLLGDLGLREIHIIEPSQSPFPDATTTAAITIFQVGSKHSTVAIRRVPSVRDLRPLASSQSVQRRELHASNRWTALTRAHRPTPSGLVPLGEIYRVHRGQVTGANRIWIEGALPHDLPDYLLFPAITKAAELFQASPILDNLSRLRRVIDIPPDLDAVPPSDLPRVRAFLRQAVKLGADKGYIATHRQAWWSVRLHDPAPIVATYMARRPPAFVFNEAGARHINIAHGLYPTMHLPNTIHLAYARYLSSNVSTVHGRTYAGGLTKFEPREMETLLVPTPDEIPPRYLREAPGHAPQTQ